MQTPKNFFAHGFRAMLPITTGVIPFGAVMGTVAAKAHLSFFQSTAMNIFVFAGAAQLAAVELMTKNAAIAVVIMSGLIINLRFLLYSAALAPIVRDQSSLKKLLCAYWITDQNYAVMSANEHILKNNRDAIQLYLGASVCMYLTWHSSVICGFIFGNFAPPTWALDYAVPLSFVALLMPTLRNLKYVGVAIFSGITSVILNPLPYRMGLIISAVLSIGFAIFITRRRHHNEPA